MLRLKQLYLQNSKALQGSQNIPVDALKFVHAKPLITEVKFRVQKPTVQFALENWYHTKDSCVGRWVESSEGSYYAPAGAYSWGVWWKNQKFGVYRIHDPFGNLMAYRIDVIKNVNLYNKGEAAFIEFNDLVADLWLWPDANGTIHDRETTVEDLDELDVLRDAGHVSLEDCAAIERVVSEVLFEPLPIVRLVDNAISAAIASNCNRLR